jgi:L-alanine-DL-glutamate epimerase-like enolase superfamily enzyme
MNVVRPIGGEKGATPIGLDADSQGTEHRAIVDTHQHAPDAGGHPLKITKIQVIPFATTIDDFANGEAKPDRKIIQTVIKISTDEGIEGHFFGGHFHGDRIGLLAEERALINQYFSPLLVGQDPLDREKIWQWLVGYKAPANLLSVIDLALWDLLGNMTGLSVHKLLGGCRDRVKAYASSFNNLGSPEEYAAHAVECQRLGYRAYKIHSNYYWDPATRKFAPPRPSHIDWDIQTARAVRKAVGDEMVLMFDPWGTYSTYADALQVGRELEALGYRWYEHPMPEHRVESYVKLAAELSIPICAPEIAQGMVFTRAEWILRRASDISRIDVLRGGITGAMKTTAMCEAFAMRCELHMSGFGNLQILGATSEDVCEFYERGLVAPGVNYDLTPPYLEAACDPLSTDGFVTVPTAPGLGYRIKWDYIEKNRVPDSDITVEYPASFG